MSRIDTTTAKQYRLEELAMLQRRIDQVSTRLGDLLKCMCNSEISTEEKVGDLKLSLEQHYKDSRFKDCANMGEILALSIQLVGEELNLVDSDQNWTPFSPDYRDE